MYRFRVPELFLGCFLTVAVFAAGMLFVHWPYPQQSTYQVSPAATQAESKEKHPENEPSGGWAWLSKDAAGFFTFGLVAVGIGQAFLFFIQLSYMRTGMNDATEAAKAAAAGARAAIEANKINRDNFLADQRPWLGTNENFAFTQPFSPTNGGYITTLEFQVMNSGKSPAFNVQVVAEMYVLGLPQKPYVIPERLKAKLQEFSSWGAGSAVFPGNTITKTIIVSLTDEDVLASAYDLGSTKLFRPQVWVGITYVSSQGTKYSTSAVFFMNGAFVGMEIPADRLSAELAHCEAT